MNKGICRVREIKDELYPHTVITVSECQRHESNARAAQVVPAPVKKVAMPRNMEELARVSAHIQAITKEETKAKNKLRCARCCHEVDEDDAVTDVTTGKVYCQYCYDLL